MLGTFLMERLAAGFFLLFMIAWFSMCSALDVTLTKTDHAIVAMQSMMPIFYLGFAAIGLSVFYPITIKALDCAGYWNTPLRKMRAAPDHILTSSFRHARIRVGWFGIIRVFSTQHSFVIPLKAGTLWDYEKKYDINPYFASYLVHFRGYKRSHNGQALIKPIHQMR